MPSPRVRIETDHGGGRALRRDGAHPPLKIHLEQLQASVRNLLVPALSGKSEFDLSGILKSVRQDGRVTIGGWAEVATKDSSVKMELREVDLVALQPYLSTAAEARVQRGALDLDLQSDVRRNRLRAPGRATLANLEFETTGAMKDTFTGVPRSAVLSYMKGRDNKITVHFTLEGDITNPQFSLNEAFATRMASALTEGLGVSIRGLAEGAGALGRKGAEVVGEPSEPAGANLPKTQDMAPAMVFLQGWETLSAFPLFSIFSGFSSGEHKDDTREWAALAPRSRLTRAQGSRTVERRETRFPGLAWPREKPLLTAWPGILSGASAGEAHARECLTTETCRFSR